MHYYKITDKQAAKKTLFYFKL